MELIRRPVAHVGCPAVDAPFVCALLDATLARWRKPHSLAPRPVRDLGRVVVTVTYAHALDASTAMHAAVMATVRRHGGVPELELRWAHETPRTRAGTDLAVTVTVERRA